MSLCEYLERVLRRGVHDSKHLVYVIVWDGLMEEIAHRVDEHDPRLPPPQWRIQRLGMQRHPEARSGRAADTIVLVLGLTEPF
jgi:hypothetical protein